MPSGAFIRLEYLVFLYVDIAMCLNVRVTYSWRGYTSFTGNYFVVIMGARTEVVSPYLKLMSALLFKLRRNRNVFFSTL